MQTSRWRRLVDRIEAALAAVAFAEEFEVEAARRLADPAAWREERLRPFRRR